MTNQVCNTVMIPVEEYEALRQRVEELTNELLAQGAADSESPEYWRGCDSATFGMARRWNKALDGKVSGGKMQDVVQHPYDRTLKLVEQLAATQADNAQLREVLGRIGDTACGEENHQFIALQALATQPDTAALDARLAQERERCAKVCDVELWDASGVANKIRSLT